MTDNFRVSTDFCTSALSDFSTKKQDPPIADFTGTCTKTVTFSGTLAASAVGAKTILSSALYSDALDDFTEIHAIIVQNSSTTESALVRHWYKAGEFTVLANDASFYAPVDYFGNGNLVSYIAFGTDFEAFSDRFERFGTGIVAISGAAIGANDIWAQIQHVDYPTLSPTGRHIVLTSDNALTDDLPDPGTPTFTNYIAAVNVVAPGGHIVLSGDSTPLSSSADSSLISSLGLDWSISRFSAGTAAIPYEVFIVGI